MWDKVRSYIDLYLNQTHIQSLTIFQTLLEQTKQLQFIPQKLATYKPENILIKKRSQQLKNGLNKFNSISIVLLRSINSNNFTFLLATEQLPTLQLSKYIFIVVVWPKQQDMITRWKQQLSLNMWVTIRQPYKYQRQGKLTYLIVRLENLVIEQGKRWKQKSQSVKQKANKLFKNKQFLQAFTMYEFALCNNHDHTKSYQRAILYCNSAACLYELRLFSSSVLYCNLAIKSDPTYPKSYSRKLNSLLQLSEYSLIPPCLLNLKSLLSSKQFEIFNQKFTIYMTNDIGIYNWQQIIDKKNNQKFGGFGQYHCSKIQIKSIEPGQSYVARQDIAHLQLILVNKPLVYFKLGNNIKQSSQLILDQVKKNCLLQKSFYQTMKLCPPVTPLLQDQDNKNNIKNINNYQQSYSSLFKHPIQEYPSNKKQQILNEQELKDKIQTSLFMQRFLQKFTDTSGYGIWRDLLYFPLDCEGNCTYIHLNNALVVFATRQIKKGQVLTIDYLAQAQPLSRTQIMQKNLNRNCQCMYCSLNAWPTHYNGDIQGLYQLIENLPNIKIKKQMIRQIIFQKAQNQTQSEVLDSLFPGIIYRYLIYVQKDPHWEDILLLLRILRDLDDHELSNKLLISLMSCFQKYLKISFPNVRNFIQQII